jgi:hypothetical protein
MKKSTGNSAHDGRWLVRKSDRFTPNPKIVPDQKSVWGKLKPPFTASRFGGFPLTAANQTNSAVRSRCWQVVSARPASGTCHHHILPIRICCQNELTRKELAAGAHPPFLLVRKSCLSQRRRGESVVVAPSPLAPGVIRRCWSILHRKREERRAYGCG